AAQTRRRRPMRYRGRPTGRPRCTPVHHHRARPGGRKTRPPRGRFQRVLRLQPLRQHRRPCNADGLRHHRRVNPSAAPWVLGLATVTTHHAAVDSHGATVAEMFDQIADRYDLVNLVMTWGQEPRFIRDTVTALKLGPTPKV